MGAVRTAHSAAFSFRTQPAPFWSFVRIPLGIRGIAVVLATVIGVLAVVGLAPAAHATTVAPSAFGPTIRDSSPLANSEGRAGHQNSASTAAQTATAPNAPDNLLAAWRSGVISLSWGPPTSDGGVPISRYEYRYSAGSEELSVSWTPVDLDLTTTVDRLTNGVAHTFEVRAVNDIGGGDAASVRAMPLAPGEGDIRITNGEDCQGLPEVLVEGAWGLICPDEFSDRSARVGCRQLGFAGGTWRKNNGSIVPPQDTPSRMGNVNCGGTEGRLADCPQEQDLQFVSCRGSGELVLLDCDTSSLGPPKNVTFIVGEPLGTLVWNAAARDGGAPITRYEYRYREANEGFSAWTDVGRDLMAVVPNPPDGAVYQFEVRAVNAAGDRAANSFASQPEPTPKGVFYDPIDYPQVETITGFTLSGPGGEPRTIVPDDDSAVAISDYYDGNSFRIQANMWAEDVQSMELELTWLEFAPGHDPALSDDRPSTTVTAVDNDAPWRLGDSGLSLRAGEYQLTGTAYGEDNKGGQPLDSLTVNFVVSEDALGSPEQLSAFWRDGEVTLSWEAPTDGSAALIASYQHRSRTEGGRFTEWAHAGADLKATIPGVENGAAYAYEVRAVSPDSLGNAARLTTPSAPGRLRSFSAVVEEGPHRLHWTAPVHNGGASIDRYEYRYRTGDGEFGTWTGAGPESSDSVSDAAAGPDFSMTIPGLEDGVGYLVEMRAVNAVGPSPVELAGIVTSGFTVHRYDEESPFRLHNGKVIDVSWYYGQVFAVVADAFDDSLVGSMELKLTGPVYHVRKENGAPWSLFGDRGPGLYSINRFWEGTYRLRATSYSEPNLKGAELETRWVEFTATEMPDAPRDLNAHWADGNLELSWRRPNNSADSDLTGYQYRYREEGGSFTAWSETVAGTSATIPNVADGAVNTYEVRSVNEHGLGESASLTTPATPGQLKGLSVVRDNGQATLKWEAAPNGGATDIAYEYAYRELNESFGPWNDAGTRHTITVSDLVESDDYEFKVRAINVFGEGPARHAATSIVIAYTLVHNGDKPTRMFLRDGSIVELADLGASKFTILAEAARNFVVGSMELELAGPVSHTQTANGAPYSLYGDRGPRYLDVRDMPAGSYQLRSTVFSEWDLTGPERETRRISFTVVLDMPDAPTGLSASWVDGNLTLHWGPPVNRDAAEVNGYQYRYRDGNGIFTDWTDAGTNLTATISGVAENAVNTYEARAVNTVGVGKTATLTTPAQASQPLNLSMARSPGQAMLSWNAPAHNGGSAITGYEYRYRELDQDFRQWNDIGADYTTTVSNLTASAEYVFEVRAATFAGKGLAASVSNSVIIDLTLTYDGDDEAMLQLHDGSVVVLTEYSSDRFAILAEVADNAPVGSIDFQLTGPTNISQTANSAPWSFFRPYAHLMERGLLLSAGNYRLRATAYEGPDLAGAELETRTVDFLVVSGLPGAPTNLQSHWTDEQVTLSWTEPANSADTLVSGYQYRSRPAGGQFTGWSEPGTSLFATIPGLGEGEAYTYEVRALNVVGPGEAVSLTSPAIPNPPASLSAARGIGYATLSWTAANNGGWTVAGYEYRYREIDGDFGPWVDLGMVFTTTVPDLTDSRGYAFEVRAENAAGKGETALTWMVIVDFKLVSDHSGHELVSDNVDLTNLRNGTVVDLSKYGSEGFGIRVATAYNPSIGSMELELTGPLSHTGIEGSPPWSLFGMETWNRDNLAGEPLPAGEYRLNATVYSKPGMNGTVLETRAVEFLVVEDMPFKPQNLSWVRDGTDFIVSWEPPTNSEKAAITGYQYQHKTGVSATLNDWSDPATELTATIPDVSWDDYFSFRVRALNAGGEGDVAALNKPRGPNKPRDFTAVIAGGNAVLTWTEPLQYNSVAISYYEYRYGELGGDFGPWTDAGKDLTVTISGLYAGATYVFEVRAANNDDHGAATRISVSQAIITGFTMLEDGNQSNSLELVDGATVALADYGVNDFAIRADLSDESKVGMVDLELSGAHVQTHSKEEGATPYSLYGDDGPDDLHGESLAIGRYTLKAIAYGKESQSGTVLGKLEISFSVVADRLTELQQVAMPNTQATGLPTIDGEAQVGQTLAADVSGITDDVDGLTNAVFSYQWVRSDGNGDTYITEATGDTYTLVAEDEGQTIKVKVFFTDDAGNAESLTSDLTMAVAPEAGPLAGFSLVAGGTGGELLELVEGVQVVTGEYSATLFAIRANLAPGKTVGSVRFHLVRDGVNVTTGGGKTESYAPYSLYGDAGENSLTGAALPAGDYRLTATAHSEKDARGDELGRLEVSFTVVETAPAPADTPAQEQQEPAPPPNSSATGQPTIEGEARVGETLTAGTSGIDDDEGLDTAVFVYQWLRGDAEIAGATGSSYTLVAADEGKTIKVTVSFTDGEGNPESLTSDPTGEVAPESGPLTAFALVDTSSDPDKVLGTLEDGRTLTLAAPAGDSYGIRVDTDPNHDDHDDIHKVVLALSGAKNVNKPEWEPPYSLYGDSGAGNLDGGNLPVGSYDLTATASKKNGDVLGTLKVSFTVEAQEQNVEPENNVPTGSPVIVGAAQVGETLTADTSGIYDEDELTNVVFSYQWIRRDGSGDADIDGATGTTYTLTGDDEGKTIEVRMSFTDDEGNHETLTSDPTGEVEAKPNTRATGAPTIDGIARVGETMTADTSGIADEDGLTNATYSYQWISFDDNSETEIANAIGSTYKLGFTDLTKKVKVSVSVTDDSDNQESLTSEPVGPVEFEFSYQQSETPVENSTVEVASSPEFWSATMTVAAVDDTHLGFSSHGDGAGSLDGHASFIYPPDFDFTVELVALDDDTLRFGMNHYLQPYHYPQWTLVVDGEEFSFEGVEIGEILGTGSDAVSVYQWPKGDLSWSDGDTVSISLKDTTPPVLAYGLVPRLYGTVIVLWSDWAGMDQVNLPPASSITVHADGNEVAVGGVHRGGVHGVGGALFALDGVSPAIKQGQTVTLTYTDPSPSDDTKAFQDGLGNDAPDFTATLVNESEVLTDISQSLAVGGPTISGTAQVGQTLTADTTGIQDANGLSRVKYSYQWIRNDGTSDEDIEGETGSTYLVSDMDVGKTIKVRVSFRDDVDYGESLTSAATAVVVATVPTEPLNLTVTTGTHVQELDASWQAPSSNGGSVITGYKVQWKETTGSWDTAADVSEALVTSTSHTITRLIGGVEHAVRVIATNDAGDGPPSEEMMGTPAGGTSQQQDADPENSEPTGLPSISGTVRVGETLTAGTAGIADADGLTNATFSYQWIRNDGTADTEIAGATADTYTLVAGDAGKTIEVKVSFTDDAGSPETLSSAATAVVAPKPNAQATGAPAISGTAQVGQTLTANTSAIADEDGLTQAVFAYQWARSDGGSDSNIQGATGSTYTLVKADEGKTITVTVSFTDDAGSSETLPSVATGEVAPKPNTQATGQPTIGGTAQVGQTLTADVTSIADEDGLDTAAFTYQWLRGDAEIAGANGETYTLVEADAGRTVKVTVSFTDEAGHAESLTSDPTGEVEAAETVPGRPQDLEGEASAQGIALTWKAPVDSVVTSYVIYRAELDDGQLHGRPMTQHATIEAAGADMAYTDAKVEAGVEYRYRVAAVNSAGEGRKSNWLDITAEEPSP